MALHRAGQATQNGTVESFNGRMRDELLNETLFTSLLMPARRLPLGRTITTPSGPLCPRLCDSGCVCGWAQTGRVAGSCNRRR